MGPAASPWEDQYRRVLRWFLRFAETTTSRVHDRESDTYQDDAYAFFVACYHLKDWLKNDPASTAAASDVEEFVAGSSALSLCGDIANGSKHLLLTTPRVDANTRMGKREYKLDLTPGQWPKISAKYEIQAAGKTYDAFKLAERCMADWERYLGSIGLSVTA